MHHAQISLTARATCDGHSFSDKSIGAAGFYPELWYSQLTNANPSVVEGECVWIGLNPNESAARPACTSLVEQCPVFVVRGGWIKQLEQPQNTMRFARICTQACINKPYTVTQPLHQENHVKPTCQGLFLQPSVPIIGSIIPIWPYQSCRLLVKILASGEGDVLYGHAIQNQASFPCKY